MNGKSSAHLPDDLDPDLIDEFISRPACPKCGRDPPSALRPDRIPEWKTRRHPGGACSTGRDPLRWHPRPGIEFCSFRGTGTRRGEGYNVVERVAWKPPLEIDREVETLLGERMKERILQRDLFFREKFEYPAFIWKEAMVNALAHRDYSLEEALFRSGCSMTVWKSAAGRLPGAGQAEQIARRQRVHYSRNPLMVAPDGRRLHESPGRGSCGYFRKWTAMELNPGMARGRDFCCLILRNTPVLDDSILEWLKHSACIP
jgi:ATP-dependent DNA helicase RecG